MQRYSAAVSRLAPLYQAILFQPIDQTYGAGMREVENLTENFDRETWSITEYHDCGSRFTGTIESVFHAGLNPVGDCEGKRTKQVRRAVHAGNVCAPHKFCNWRIDLYICVMHILYELVG